ncbi:hypothetical protein [Flavobacterium sp. XS2P39]|uniref:hypothetical protein n=1 Tax=Flavobacterium sp. XS2P39 TaxID=3401725 RepID=UPI003AABA4C2
MEIKIQEIMTNAEIIEIFNNSLNLDSRLKFLEDLLKVKEDGIGKSNLSICNKINKKCKSIYSKSELAHLFYLLMDEGVLFFDTVDERNNRARLQDFLVENFTYAGDSGFQVGIKSISKQFSECKGFSYKEKQIRFLDELIIRIQQRKERLINW